MRKYPGFRIALIVIQLVLLVSMLIRPSAGGDRRAAMLMASIAVPLWIVSVILAANLAARLHRMVGGWIAGAIFLPGICPLILAFLGERPAPVRPGYAQSPLPEAAADSIPRFDECGFCARCVAETSDESPGNVNTVNGIGTALMGSRWFTKGLEPCPICGSVIQGKWVTFGFGIAKLGTYRVLYVKRGFTNSRFFGRRLLSDYEAPVGSARRV